MSVYIVGLMYINQLATGLVNVEWTNSYMVFENEHIIPLLLGLQKKYNGKGNFCHLCFVVVLRTAHSQSNNSRS